MSEKIYVVTKNEEIQVAFASLDIAKAFVINKTSGSTLTPWVWVHGLGFATSERFTESNGDVLINDWLVVETDLLKAFPISQPGVRR